ncbi:MAG: hypothetical protein ACK5UX_12585 [Burkholderiales bacterium]
MRTQKKSKLMRSISILAILAWLSVLSGCIAVLPISEYVPTTSDGIVHTSNCLSAKTVQYRFGTVPVSVWFESGASESPQLTVCLNLSEGQVVRFPAPEVRVTSIDEGAPEVRHLPQWERKVFRRMTPGGNRLERVTVETAPATGPLVGGIPNDGAEVMGLGNAKSFKATIPMRAGQKTGYRIELPAIEINGTLYEIGPIESRLHRRVEIMAPLNC